MSPKEFEAIHSSYNPERPTLDAYTIIEGPDITKEQYEQHIRYIEELLAKYEQENIILVTRI